MIYRNFKHRYAAPGRYYVDIVWCNATWLQPTKKLHDAVLPACIWVGSTKTKVYQVLSSNRQLPVNAYQGIPVLSLSHPLGTICLDTSISRDS